MRFRMRSLIAVAIVFNAAHASPIDAKPKEMSAADDIARDGLDKGTRSYVTKRLKSRQYFMGKSEKACTPVSPAPPGYESVSVMDCTYQLLGLNGWVRLPVLPADLLSDWILKAASLCKKPESCAATIATQVWTSNNFSFPMAGNVIEDAGSAGGSGAAGLNLIFINGVTVGRPAFLPERTKATIEAQKQCSLALLATANGETASPVAGDATGSCTKLTSAQVSRPAAVRQDIYVSYGDPSKTEAQRLAEVGTSCPPKGRKIAWLAISRSDLITGLQTRDHPLFDAAARAIDAGETYLGKLKCKG